VKACLFCQIVQGAIPSKKVYEDEACLAFEDVNPQAPVHVLVVPKRHAQSLVDMQDSDAGLLGHLLLTCSRVAHEKMIESSGYRVVLNVGRNAGQTVFHLHFHVLGGRVFHWPPG